MDRIDSRLSDDPYAVTPAGDAATLHSWGENLKKRRAEFKASQRIYSEEFSRAAWAAWEIRLKEYVSVGALVVDPASYADIVCCAADAPPGNMFRRDLGVMSLVEWSELCLSGFPSTSKAPGWTFAAGLCALGFSRRIVREAVTILPQEVAKVSWDFVELAQDTEAAGSLLIMLEEGSIGSMPVARPLDPVLALPLSKLEGYLAAIDWLQSRDALSRVIDEERPNG